MPINRAALKADARLDIKQTKPNVILFTLVFLLIYFVLEILSSSLSGELLQIKEIITALLNDAETVTIPEVSVSPVASIIVFAIGLMATMLSTGYSLFCLNAIRRRTPAYGNLFDPFALFFKIWWLTILTNLFIALWTMLFVIPGIIASYRYRQAVYILLEHPECSALDCIRESKRIMQGHKAELFVLDLSFIGWILLCMIPFVLLWVQPYVEMTNVRFYIAIADGALPCGGDGGTDSGFGGGTPPWEN